MRLAPGPDNWGGTAAAAKAIAAEVEAVAAEVFGGVVVGDEVICQRHSTR